MEAYEHAPKRTQKKIQGGERITKADLKRACIDKCILNLDANDLAKERKKINEFADSGNPNEDVHVFKGAMMRSMEFLGAVQLR